MKSKLSLTLRDGRKFSYLELGDHEKEVILLIHGTPFSGRMWENLEWIKKNTHYRIIAVDRPGYGHSDSNGEDTFNEFHQDIIELLNYLKLDKISAIGVSGGGSYILKLALEIPDRLDRIAIVSSVGPCVEEAIGDMNSNRNLYKMAKKLPKVIIFQNHLVLKMIRKDPEKFVRLAKKKLKGTDLKFIESNGFEKELALLYQDGCIQESTVKFNMMTHDILQTANWSIDLTKIDKLVHVYWGGHDKSIGDQTKYIASQLPNAVEHFYSEEGHFLLFRKSSEIFDSWLKK